MDDHPIRLFTYVTCWYDGPSTAQLSFEMVESLNHTGRLTELTTPDNHKKPFHHSILHILGLTCNTATAQAARASRAPCVYVPHCTSDMYVRSDLGNGVRDGLLGLDEIGEKHPLGQARQQLIRFVVLFVSHDHYWVLFFLLTNRRIQATF